MSMPFDQATMELGSTGAKKTGAYLKGLGGWYDEEFHRDLRTIRDRMRAYQQMRSNDGVLGICSNVSLALLRRLDWKWVRPDDKPKSKYWQEYAESMTSEREMRHSMDSQTTEAYSLRDFGNVVFEKILKQRKGEVRTKDGRVDRLRSSKFTDGKWAVADAAVRKQTSIQGWVWDDDENLVAMIQAARAGSRKNNVPIPYGKLVHMRALPNGDDPEGWTPLRWLYRLWRISKGVEDNQSTGVQKEATGVLLGKVPSKLLNPNVQGNDATARQAMINVLSGFHNNELAHFLWASDRDALGHLIYDLQAISSAGPRGYNALEIMRYYDALKAAMWNMQFIHFGGQGKGSQALSLDTTDMYELSVESYADIVEDGWNDQLFADVWDANNVPEEHRPRWEHGSVAKRDLEKFAKVMTDLTNATLLTPDGSLEDFVRDELNLPERDPVDEDDELPDDTIPQLDDPEPEVLPEPRAKRRARLRDVVRGGRGSVSSDGRRRLVRQGGPR